jgi:hypothetical protein
MDTCIVTGTIVSGDGTPKEGAIIHAIPYDSPAIIEDTENALIPLPITVYTSSTGEFELTLLRSVRFTVTIPLLGFRKVVRIPDSTTAVLWGLSDIDITGDATPREEGDTTNW